MIKIFTSGADAEVAGDRLTTKFENWLNENTEGDMGVEIISIDSNSNKYGWMLVVHYKLINNK